MKLFWAIFKRVAFEGPFYLTFVAGWPLVAIALLLMAFLGILVPGLGFRRVVPYDAWVILTSPSMTLLDGEPRWVRGK